VKWREAVMSIVVKEKVAVVVGTEIVMLRDRCSLGY